MVNKELDNSKNYDKKARNIQNKLKELIQGNFKSRTDVYITKNGYLFLINEATILFRDPENKTNPQEIHIIGNPIF